MDLGGSFLAGLSRATTVMRKATTTAPAKSNAPMPQVHANGSSEDFFIRMAFDLLANTKEYRRMESLRNAVQAAVETLDNPLAANDPLSVFLPFQIACKSGHPELLAIAIDCLGKLFSYNYWKTARNDVVPKIEDEPKKPQEDGKDLDGTQNMISFVIDTICDAFSGESTYEKVELQIIKALQAALTNTDSEFSLHGAILLKVIRTSYNIFLLTKSLHVQSVAQGTVIQMVQNVFSRVPKCDQTLSVAQNINHLETVRTDNPTIPELEIEDSDQKVDIPIIQSFKADKKKSACQNGE